MKVIANEKLIKRNQKIGTYTNIAALVVLLGGVALSYIRRDLYWVTLVSLVVGFTLTQFSFYFTNRFGRRMPLHVHIANSLKGLSNEYRLYQYYTPADHLLIGPAGIWAILPYHQKGTITYERGRWKQKSGGLAQTYMKIFGQEGLGRVDLDLEADISGTEDFLRKELGGDPPEVRAAIVFVDKRADLQVDGAPVPTLYPEDLKDLIRRSQKANSFPADTVKRIQALLPELEGKS